MTQTLALASLAAAALGVLALAGGIASARGRRPLGAGAGFLSAAALLAVAALLALLSVATVGYRALTHEAVAAVVETRPTGAREFEARFRFPDGGEATFQLAGEELYVDAHILKWKPVVNVLGLHTAYELDRVAGRYGELADERQRPRTVHSLARERPLNLFTLRRSFPILAPLVDAEYGSATFIAARRPARYEVRVSTSGLLIREVPGAR